MGFTCLPGDGRCGKGRWEEKCLAAPRSFWEKREHMSGLDFVLGTKERECETGKNGQSPDPSKNQDKDRDAPLGFAARTFLMT